MNPQSDLLMYLNSRMRSTDIVLDIGCGDKRYHCIKCERIFGVDAWPKAEPDYLLNLEERRLITKFKPNSVDVVLLLDIIEHLGKKKGKLLLKDAKRIAKREVIVLTPLWWHDNSEEVNNEKSWYYGNPFNLHKSLWTIDDFEDFERKRIHVLKNYFIGSWNKNGMAT